VHVMGCPSEAESIYCLVIILENNFYFPSQLVCMTFQYPVT